MGDVERSIGTIRAGLDQRLEIEEEDAEYDIYNVKPFNLVSPDITGVTDTLREKYKVRDDYENAVHTAYNGLNAFERKVAEALDSLGKPWCRNPVGEGYFRIPIPQLGADDIWFYPDFLLWTNKEIWALDPKGKHIREAAVQNKLLDLPTSGRITLPVKIALILEGTYVHDAQQKLSKDTKDGFTLVKRGRSEVKVVPCKSVIKMVEALVGR